jgi:hypothetical protein
MANRKLRRFGQILGIIGLRQNLPPEQAGNIGQNAATVPFSSDTAGAMPHFYKGLDGSLQIAMGRLAMFFEEPDDGTCVAFIDADAFPW